MKINGTSGICEPSERATASHIANEFQTPLGVIILAGEVLENYFDRLTPEQRRLALGDILSAARQMNHAMDSFVAIEKDRESIQRKRSASDPSQQRRGVRQPHAALNPVRRKA